MNNSTTTIPGVPQTTASSNNGTDTTTTFPEQQAAMILWKFYTPGLLLLGGFGNLTTILVMRRFKDRNAFSQRIILMALAVSDLLLLYVGALRDWLFFVFNVKVTSMPCKVGICLTYVMGTIGVAVGLCHRAKNGGGEVAAQKLRDSDSVIRDWVDISFSIIPSVCLVVCDVILSRILFKTFASAAAVSSTVYAISNTPGHSDSRRKRASKTTVMVLALSCTFILLTLPGAVYMVWVSYFGDQLTNDPRLLAISKLGLTVTTLLWYTNSAINFLLYCFTGSKFRKEFFSMVCCSCLFRGLLSGTDHGLSKPVFIFSDDDQRLPSFFLPAIMDLRSLHHTVPAPVVQLRDSIATAVYELQQNHWPWNPPHLSIPNLTFAC
ncbi:uncharacterized protein LOC143298646 [Babylonia areolata]|uniref:uncharacterized protein LOC143298646 n=1 Tax=Babylonia areolata TaxID=304850 RepID=UPI003FD53685